MQGKLADSTIRSTMRFRMLPILTRHAGQRSSGKQKKARETSHLWAFESDKMISKMTQRFECSEKIAELG
jgi:hypothetical protein